MKCAVCEKEFGNGANCQSCGTDRVTGLANYSGYDNHTGNGHHSSSDKMEYVSNRTTACYACGEIIPADAEYCPYCRKKLFESCPKCGKTYSSQYDNCPKCGTNRDVYYKQKEAEEQLAQLKEEARKIKLSLNSRNGILFLLFCFIGLIIGFVIWNKLWGLASFGDYVVSGWTGGAFGGLIYSSVESYCIGKKIKRWKQEHPNDPRRDYL